MINKHERDFVLQARVRYFQVVCKQFLGIFFWNFRIFLELFWNCFGIVLEFLRFFLEFFGNSIRILCGFLGNQDFFWENLKIFLELFWNLGGIFQIFFLEFYQNSLWILREFFGNSLGILLEFFGDVWIGGSECLGVDLGQFWVI